MAPHDLLGRIAKARADMMMRGYQPLQLEIGRKTLQELMAEGAVDEVGDMILTMLIHVRSDMEGFAVRPRNT